jgi:protein SCO1/2
MVSRSKLLSFALLCFAAGGGIILSRHQPVTPTLATGAMLMPSRSLGDFSLIDNHGREFGPGELRGKWSLMFFGYTHCRDFCPSTLTTLAALEKHIRADRTLPPPRVIFVSVDAKRDTPAQLDRYVPNFDSEFIGLTAPDQAKIEAIARGWNIAVKVPSPAEGDYGVDHSGAIFVIDPSGKLAAILTGPFTVEALSEDYRRILSARA